MFKLLTGNLKNLYYDLIYGNLDLNCNIKAYIRMKNNLYGKNDFIFKIYVISAF